MRKILLAALLLACTLLSAQNRTYKNAIQAKLNLIDFGQLYNGKPRLSQGFEIGYFRNLAPYLNVGVPLKLGLAKLPETTDNAVTFSGDLLFHICNLRTDYRVSPFVFGGVGYFVEKFEKSHVQYPFGLGMHVRVSPYAYVSLQGEYRKAAADDRDNINISFGYLYLLHKALPTVPKFSDRDKDGVDDTIDRCPDQVGVKEAFGCPDADLDGVRDIDDACINEPGPAELKGCPDTDGDGVANKDDHCPEEAGVVNGCPDRDGDGVEDEEDDCPDQPGPASNLGCPSPKTIDTDGDGFPDDSDKCPDLPGTNMGCPDSDGDGVADNFDKCPDQPGKVSNMGCPEEEQKDSDGDGVVDTADKCPDTAGPATNYGCPEVKQEVKEKLAFAAKAVQFETSSAKLKQESYVILDEIVEIMRQYPEYKLAISGHTDNIGDDTRNQKLSENRAKSCLDYLVFRGITAERLRSAGFGEAKPLSTNDTSEGRERNRRVEFEMVLN